jgi:hypothetical protein
MRNQSEFGPKMLGIRGILAFHFTQRSSAPKAVKGSKKKYEIDGNLPSLLSSSIL